jgi:fucose 4-O-acetylase-like acetyltransferase
VLNKRTLLFIGQNTIGIYLLHKNFLQEVVIGSFSSMGWTEPQALVAFVSAIITLTFAYFGVKVINRYIPQLIGRFPQNC